MLEVGPLEQCDCCHLVETQAHVFGAPRCSLCRDFCREEEPCWIREMLEGGREGSEKLVDRLAKAIKREP